MREQIRVFFSKVGKIFEEIIGEKSYDATIK
jgi:hypothetical protein